MNLKFAAFADTPFQVLNILNFVYHNVEGCCYNCDLYIYKNFSGYELMIDKIRNSRLFSNVIECHLPINKNENKLEHSVRRLYEIFNPRKCIKEWTDNNYKEEYYDIILIPAPLPFTVALCEINPKARVWFYEDGAVNYYGDVLNVFGSHKKKLLKFVFNKGPEKIVPDRMYVNNVSMSKTTRGCSIYPLPKLESKEKEFFSLLYDVFGYVGNDMRKKAIFLSQPMEIMGCTKQEILLYNSILKELLPYKDKLGVKLHPKERENRYFTFDLIKTGVFWELLCATEIAEDNLLIGVFSTAQLTPKLLYDKEPYLLFTYKLVGFGMNAKNKELDKFVDEFKSSYRNPNKVINVSSVVEYKEALHDYFFNNFR
jgi:hypothetical protein